jgi:cyclopropane-fatty-acyl-phospholipid synthase
VADRRDLDFTYSLTDRIIRLSLGARPMVFGSRMIPLEQIGAQAPHNSDAWILALVGCQFPGSWLPSGQEQLVCCADPHFRLVTSTSGRLDYIETVNQWNARVRARSLRKALLKLRLVPRWLTSTDFRLAFTSGVSANQICFERELTDHFRLVFEKTS